VYAGLGGGHLVEWYPHTLASPRQRRSEPWEHLRQRRFKADCYLNELRVADYTALFERYFKLEAVNSLNAGHGRAFLDPATRTELSAYSEDELLSDKWQFVLRKRQS
jgi:hypothetical protein